MTNNEEHTASYYAATANVITDFPRGKWFANPAAALGMLYYRLKELL